MRTPYKMISEAIRQRKLLRFQRNGRTLVVEPHALGTANGMDDTLLYWQGSFGTISSADNWQLIALKDIYGLSVLEQRFPRPAPGRQPPPIESTFSSGHVDLAAN